MAKQNYFYLQVRVDIDKEVNDSKMQEIIEELDYSIKSKTKNIEVVATEIKDFTKTII